MTKLRVKLRTLLVIGAGVALLSSGGKCFAQEAARSDESTQQLRILMRTNGVDIPSPEFGDPQGKEVIERLQHAFWNSFKGAQRRVEVAVLAVPEAGKEGPEGSPQAGHPRVGLSFTGPPPAGAPNFGPPGFGPPGMRMGGRAELHPGQGSQIHHPEAHSPEGPFAEDRQRIAALTESAERIAQAGLPEVAQGLRERAGQLERELAEKQERMQQEKRQRAEAEMRERQEQARQQPRPHQPQRLMELRREGIERGDHPAPPLRELHGQMEQLRRDMHKLSEQMAELTRLIQQHHYPRKDRGHQDDGDDDEGDDDDDVDEDDDDEDDDDEDMEEHDEEEMDDDNDDFPDHKEREEHEKE